MPLHPRFDEVLIFCPEVPTGGPEAMHQLGHDINRLGGNAAMVYYGPHSRLEWNGATLTCTGQTSPMLAHFASYQPRAASEVKPRPQTLVIYPEVLAQQAAQPAANPRAMWWLSVDNALVNTPFLQDEKSRRQFFADASLIHLYQSGYARDFLQKSGAQNMYPLSDYTDPLLTERSSTYEVDRPNAICFFPTKGAELAKLFLTSGALRHPIDLIPIHKMTKPQVRETLAKARIFIDFGHHPGKDRVPREAAAAGAIVLLNAVGAANFHADHPLTDMYRFTADDIRSGQLHARIDAMLDDPQKHFDAQEPYRAAIRAERAKFESEVRSFFFSAA